MPGHRGKLGSGPALHRLPWCAAGPWRAFARCRWPPTSPPGREKSPSVMPRAIPIAQLTVTDVRAEVRRALRGGLSSSALADFLASVDWGAFDTADAVVRRMLGELERWSTEYAEGDRSLTEYAASLTELVEPGAPVAP